MTRRSTENVFTTPGDLEECLQEYFQYEVWMLLKSFQRLCTISMDRIATNAYVESFCLHARSLDDFFTKSSRSYPTDILAKDFGPQHFSPMKIEAREKINHQIVHLTSGKTKVDAYKLSIEIPKALGTLITNSNEFIKCLPPQWKYIWDIRPNKIIHDPIPSPIVMMLNSANATIGFSSSSNASRGR